MFLRVVHMNCSCVQASQDLKAFVSLRFDAPVLALCVDDFPLHFIRLASSRSLPKKDNDSGKSKGSKRGHSKGKNNKKEFKGTFEAGDELAETGYIGMASIDLNALEIGAVQLPDEDHRIRIGIDSCAAVTVFPKSVASTRRSCNMCLTAPAECVSTLNL